VKRIELPSKKRGAHSVKGKEGKGGKGLGVGLPEENKKKKRL